MDSQGKNARLSNGGHKENLMTQATGEINKIFETIVKKKTTFKVNSETRKQKNKLNKRTKKNIVIKKNSNKNLNINNHIKPVRYLNDGLPVYRLEDINLGK